MSRIRYVWTVTGDDHDFATGDRNGINGYFLPMFDQPLTSRAALTEVKRRGHAAGIYLGAGWLPIETDAQRATLIQKVEAEYQRCLVPGLKVMFNLEEGGVGESQPPAILDVLKRWRALHPTVGTTWSMEPMQGGWMGGDVSKGHAQSSFVTEILKLKIRLVPQLFFGNMAPAGEPNVQWNLAARGFPASILSPFYDAAALPSDWDGYAFTAGRLPSTARSLASASFGDSDDLKSELRRDDRAIANVEAYS